MKRCGCCERDVADWDHLYGCCGDCAWCQSLGHCYEGEDKPENTICCHGSCQRGGQRSALPESGQLATPGSQRSNQREQDDDPPPTRQGVQDGDE